MGVPAVVVVTGRGHGQDRGVVALHREEMLSWGLKALLTGPDLGSGFQFWQRQNVLWSPAEALPPGCLASNSLTSSVT